MGTGRNLTPEKRASIVALREAGFTQRTIAHRVNCSRSTVAKNVEQFRQMGSNKDRPRSGRPRSSSPAQDRFLGLISRRNRFWTAPLLKAQWQNALGRVVSVATVRRRFVYITL